MTLLPSIFFVKFFLLVMSLHEGCIFIRSGPTPRLVLESLKYVFRKLISKAA